MVLWKHQKAAVDFCLHRPAAMLAFDMGTGKSRIVVELCRRNTDWKVLILCPKAVIPHWPREFRQYSGREDILAPLNGTVASKRVLAEQSTDNVFVFNYDAAIRKPLSAWLLEQSWDLVVCDESHRCQSPSSRSSRLVERLGMVSKKRICLTGTPMPHSPLDAFGQYRFLDPEIFGDSWISFRSQYAVLSGPHQNWITGYKNTRELKQKFATIALRCDSEDVLDLPEAIDSTRLVTLSGKAQRVYRDLEKDFISSVKQGVITVANALVKVLRLQQITSGHLPTDHGVLVNVDNAKRDSLTEWLEDLPPKEPVVVFGYFKSDLATTRHAAESCGRKYLELSGTLNELSEWQERALRYPTSGDVLGVQIKSGGTGVDLTRARYCGYLSTGFNLGDYLQSRKRLHRPGQKRTVFYTHFIAANTIDETVVAALARRQEVVEAVIAKVSKADSLQTASNVF